MANPLQPGKESGPNIIKDVAPLQAEISETADVRRSENSFKTAKAEQDAQLAAEKIHLTKQLPADALPNVAVYADGRKRSWEFKNGRLHKIEHADGQEWERQDRKHWNIKLHGKLIGKNVEITNVKIDQDRHSKNFKTLTWTVKGVTKSLSREGVFFDPTLKTNPHEVKAKAPDSPSISPEKTVPAKELNKTSERTVPTKDSDKSLSQAKVSPPAKALDIDPSTKGKVEIKVTQPTPEAKQSLQSKAETKQFPKLKLEENEQIPSNSVQFGLESHQSKDKLFMKFVSEGIFENELARNRKVDDRLLEIKYRAILRDKGNHKADVGKFCFNGDGDAALMFETMRDMHPKRYVEILGHKWAKQLATTDRKEKHNCMNAPILENHELKEKVTQALSEFHDSQDVAGDKVTRDGWGIAAHAGYQKLLKDLHFKATIADFRVRWGPNLLKHRLLGKKEKIKELSPSKAIDALCLSSDDRSRSKNMKKKVEQFKNAAANDVQETVANEFKEIKNYDPREKLFE